VAQIEELTRFYEAEITRLREYAKSLEQLLERERREAVKNEYRMGFLDSEVKGLLEGKEDVTKQAAMLVLSMAERYSTIMNAAKHLQRGRVPWGMIGLAAFTAAVLAPLAYFLSIPENFRTLVMWMSVWTNQVFVGGIALVALVVAFLVFRRRRMARA